MTGEATLIIIVGLFLLYYKILKPNGMGLVKPKPKQGTVTIERTRTLTIPIGRAKPESKPDPNAYTPFPGTTANESEADDTEDECHDLGEDEQP